MAEKNVKILLVEDNPDDAYLLTAGLKGSAVGFKLARVGRLDEALGVLKKESFDLIILDLGLPDSQGMETLLRVNEKVNEIPVIILTGNDDEELAVKAVQAGGQDYLVKDRIEPDLLVKSIRYAIERNRLVSELRRANKKILEHQRSLIEEERLKVLLQLAGATAHELNQPLTALLGNIDLIRFLNNVPDELEKYLLAIENSGKAIAEIVSKVQNIRWPGTKVNSDDNRVVELDRKLTVLSVEDSDRDFEKITAMLKDKTELGLLRARNISEASSMLEKSKCDLVLLDYLLPDGNGLDFIKLMNKKELDIPLIVITGGGDETIAAQVLRDGAYDYLPKNRLSERSLTRCIANAMEKHRLRKEIEQAQKKIAKMATTDELTGLYNRRYFIEALNRELSRAGRYKTTLGLGMIDVDNFKKVNDTYGHPAGDRVLCEISSRLTKCIRESDIPGRYGGEEFAVILPRSSEKQTRVVCERFRKLTAGKTFEHGHAQFNLTVSIGFSIYDNSKLSSTEALIAAADQALYQAKREGKNRVIQKSI